MTGTADKSNQDTTVQTGTPADGKGLEEKNGGAEKLYSQAELDAQLGRAGQRLQAKLDTVTAERDQYKGQAEQLTTEMTGVKAEIASLTKDIEAMSDNDPDKQTVLKLRRQKEAELAEIKKERDAIASEKNEIAQWKRDQLVYTIADEYVNAAGEPVDMDAFKARADRFKLTEREDLEDLAITMGLKLKSEQPPTDGEKPGENGAPFVGRQSGHETFVRDPNNPTKTLEHGFNKLKQRT